MWSNIAGGLKIKFQYYMYTKLQFGTKIARWSNEQIHPKINGCKIDHCLNTPVGTNKIGSLYAGGL